MIDRRPVIIARCVDADDVVAVVDLARENDLPLSVHGGGHGVTGSAVVDAGICVDMRGMKGIDVDPEQHTVPAEAGLTWGEFDAAAQEHGLAVTGAEFPRPGSPDWPSAAAAAGSSARWPSPATT